MRTFELRQYTLCDREALDIYMNQVYPRHLNSFPLFGIDPHGIWTVKDSTEPQAFVLVSYPEGEDPGEVVRRYMGSAEFAEETKDWDRSNIVAVQSTILSCPRRLLLSSERKTAVQNLMGNFFWDMGIVVYHNQSGCPPTAQPDRPMMDFW